MKKTATRLSTLIAFIFISSHTQAQQRERLVAVGWYWGGSGGSIYTDHDSTLYIYGGERSVDSGMSYLYDDVYAYDTSYVLAGGLNTLIETTVKTWNASNQMLTDTVRGINQLTGQFYEIYDTFSYNSMGLPLIDLSQERDSSRHAWLNYQLSIAAYDTAGRQLMYAWVLWDTIAQAWDTNVVIYRTYDNTGRLVYENSVGDAYMYSYDSLGRIDTIATFSTYDTVSTLPGMIQINTYDSLSRLSSQTYLMHNDSNQFYNYMRNLYAYDSQNDPVIMLQQYWDTSGWYAVFKYLYSYDAYHHDTFYIILDTSAGQWLNSNRYEATYDSYGMITWSSKNTWEPPDSTGAWVLDAGDNGYFYTYQLYTPDTNSGIVSITPSGDLRIYPIPVSSMLTVDLTWCDAQASTATIYDATGRRCADYPLPNTTSYHGYIPITALPDGIYTMVIKGIKGSVTKQFSVMR